MASNNNNRLPTYPENSNNAGADADADLAKAFQELAKGERTASAMETQLTALERKLDDLLATVASADAGGSKRDEAAPETASHVTRTHQNQPDEK